MTEQDKLIIAGKAYSSRLLVGTGKYKDLQETSDAVEASGAEIITIAVRRSNIGQNPDEPNLLDVLPLDRYTLLPNTAGCYNIEDAVRTCRLARELLDGHDLVKLEVLGDKKTLLPDPLGTLEALKVLKDEGFCVLCYTNDDPIMATRLKDAGADAVMPAGSPIGSGQGVLNPWNIRIILEQLKDGDESFPVIVDAGVGTASDVTIAMEIGADGVLLNTGIAGATDCIAMAHAMRLALESGYLARRAGRIPRKLYATASSPVEGVIGAEQRS